MDEVTGGMIRIIVFIILLVLFGIGIIGLIRKAANKKFYIIMLIIPILLVYSMYFSGYFRKAPFDEENIQELIEMVQTGYDSEKGLRGSAENGVIEYSGYIHSGKISELYWSEFILEKLIHRLFSRIGTYNDKAYYIGPASSDKGSYWEASCHVGYGGIIAVQLDHENYLELHYTISRKIDKYLGFFYAPPLFRMYSFNTAGDT